jgi:hypothetical protein
VALRSTPFTPEAAILHPGVERKFYLRADVRVVSGKQAESMTEFDAVTVQGLRKRYGFGVVVDRLDSDVSRGQMVGVADANGAAKTITVECIQGLWVAGAVDLFATARARDGTELREQSAPGGRARWGFSQFSGRERHRLFLVGALPGRAGRTS